MRQWMHGARAWRRSDLTAGLLILAGACALATAPKSSVTVDSATGIPLTSGSLRMTATSAILDTTFQVSVVVANGGTTQASFPNGPCGLQFALYNNAAF